MRLAPSGTLPGSRRRSPASFVLKVGQHVFVNCPGDRSRSAPLGDESGESVSTVSLADGADVEVLAWRPRTPTGPRYRIRAYSTGTDGWIAASNLRTVFVPFPESTPPSPPATVASHGSGRQSGPYTPRECPPAAAPSASPEPAPADDIVGRRFGQRS